MLDVAAPLANAQAQQPVTTAPVTPQVSFCDVLSALNPLQYLPVIGTIYRAVTGDQIPEAMRRIGSLVVSGLLGGPIGVAINLVVMVAEKVTGIDLDQTGQMLLTGNGQSGHSDAEPKPAASHAPQPAENAAGPVASVPAAVPAWSPAQLAAYGVQTAGDGALKLADLRGADVLNALELLRIRGAQAAYGRAVRLAG